MIYKTKCGGCEGPPEFDHYHQYVNVRGDAVERWSIDGKVFSSLSETVIYLKKSLSCSTDEAGTYIQKLRRIYG